MTQEITKQCTKCWEHKPRTAQHWYKIRGYFSSPCKACRLQKPSATFNEARRARQNADYAKNPEKYKEKERLRRQRDPSHARKMEIARRHKDIERTREVKRLWSRENRDRINAANRAKRAANPEKVRSYYAKRYEETDYRLNCIVSASINKHLKNAGSAKTSPKASLVGWRISELREHLVLLFEPGMSFANHGAWHLDHIIPVSAVTFFGANDPLFAAVWSLENLAPLWAKDNQEKRASLKWQLPDTYTNPLLRSAYSNRNVALLDRNIFVLKQLALAA
ncbi:hypothetical protein [Mesorhizobium sp. M0859]|uniref:hypothetical protein n=1 Tax=Mesorhizobium sp. M0859 TaxID=2957014 RepID=UPI0033362D55